MNIFFDTSILVASCLGDHEHHEVSHQAIEAAINNSNECFVGAHSLLETFSVLTRIPRSPRILPLQASEIIEGGIVSNCTVIALTSKEHVQFIQSAAKFGVFGGQIYDRLHIECALKCNAERLYTLNVREFAALAQGLNILVTAP